ncbi:hypothetical protein S7335_4056 [Synechococcus sp. PCC 7335]|uniref:ParA family protein n=1 Tax=Synechococcus sp. (strain ATCC 29403 / PCC 7335) TaxID=91464 RepID=UPI00017EC06C|nr:ParA family protein [Synechococcus sp. PCC 7335]EDX86352.1 hypothetical protein S7335_4056 [Synechococcus sp. PCC 7335]
MIITVASFKGGVGKTTSAIHLTAFLQGQGETVLIDADPNRSALGWASRGDLPFNVVDQWTAEQTINPSSNVVIDTPARPIPEDLSALASTCDLLVLPTTPDVLALDALVLTIEYLKAIGTCHYRILLTSIPPKPSKAGEEVKELLQGANLPIFEQGIRRFAAFQKAALQGVPVYMVKDPRAEACWQDYETVGNEILEIFGVQDSANSPSEVPKVKDSF